MAFNSSRLVGVLHGIIASGGTFPLWLCGTGVAGASGRGGRGVSYIVTKYDIKYVVLFRMPFHRTFATGRTRTYVVVLDNKRLRKCDRRRVRPVAKYLFQVAPSVYE